mmetsp:Transcript_24805/g.58203  ORF Transcript_24805/g.58203 Transcript_24805/m.58203 type:complete len:261 (-) Transcript_24805:468-1250(-)
MALKSDEESFTLKDIAVVDEKGGDRNLNVDKPLDDWIAPDPMARPTLFSGGGEDPLEQLHLYCQSNRSAKTLDNESAPLVDTDELLSVAEFLFGPKAMMAALAIVDSRRSLITKLVAPSGRSVHLIESSAAPISARDKKQTRDIQHGDENYYLCLLSSPSRSSRPVRYCSCHSFLEKSTKKASALAAARVNSARMNINDENCHDGPPVCKHLLALFLLPYLAAASSSTSGSHNSGYNTSYPEIKTITEREFARFILDRVL